MGSLGQSSAPRGTCRSQPASLQNLVVTCAHSYRTREPSFIAFTRASVAASVKLRTPGISRLDHCQMHSSPCHVPEQHQWECNPTENAQAVMSAWLQTSQMADGSAPHSAQVEGLN